MIESTKYQTTIERISTDLWRNVLLQLLLLLVCILDIQHYLKVNDDFCDHHYFHNITTIHQNTLDMAENVQMDVVLLAIMQNSQLLFRFLQIYSNKFHAIFFFFLLYSSTTKSSCIGFNVISLHFGCLFMFVTFCWILYNTGPIINFCTQKIIKERSSCFSIGCKKCSHSNSLLFLKLYNTTNNRRDDIFICLFFLFFINLFLLFSFGVWLCSCANELVFIRKLPIQWWFTIEIRIFHIVLLAKCQSVSAEFDG